MALKIGLHCVVNLKVIESDYDLQNTSKNDLANIAIKSNVSFSTIRDVVYRTNSPTKLNAKAISLLMHAAFENSVAHKLQARGIMFTWADYLIFSRSNQSVCLSEPI